MKKPEPGKTPDNKKPSSSKPASRASHSKSAKEPVTIDLKADKVTAKPAEPKKPAATSTPKVSAAKTTASKPSDAKTGDTKMADAMPETAKPAFAADEKSGKPATSSATKPAAEAGKTPSTTTDRRSGPSPAASKAEAGKPDAKPAPASSTPPRPTASKPEVRATPPAAAPKQKSGTFGKLVAAVIGGLVALGGAGALQYLGYLGTPGAQLAAQDDGVSAQDIDALETRIADIQTQIAAVQAAPSDEVEPDMSSVTTAVDNRLNEFVENTLPAEIDRRVAALPQATTSEGGAAPAADLTPRLEALDTRLSETASTVDTLETTMQERLAQTQSALDDLNRAIASGSAGEDAGLSALESRLSALADQVGTLSTDLADTRQQVETSSQGDEANEALEQQTAANEQAIAQNASAIEALGERIDEARTALAEQIETSGEQAVTEATATLNSRIDEVAQEANKVSGLTVTLNEIAARLSQTQQTVEARAETLASLEEATKRTSRVDRQAAQAIAAAAVKSDIDEGQPFAASLKTLRDVAEDETLLQPLDAYAQSGVPTAASLTQRFDAVADRMLEAVSEPQDESLSARLLSGARSLVKVRPLEPQKGDTPEAIVSRLRAAVQSGDLKSADTLWQSLPETAKSVSADWHNDLTARVEANRLVGQSVQSFLLSTSGG